MKKSNYDLVKEIVDSCEDERILNSFNNEFEVGKNVSKSKYFDFFNKFVDDGSEYYYIKLNWKYIKSGGDESVYKEV
jgi:hypothetical protein